jgi:hypothetical protein
MELGAGFVAIALWIIFAVPGTICILKIFRVGL